MKVVLACVLACVSLAVYAQDPASGSTAIKPTPIINPVDQGKDPYQVVVPNPTEVNAADRAAVQRGVGEVNRGMQGFFQALNDAVARAHKDRAAAEAGAKANPVKSSAADAKSVENEAPNGKVKPVNSLPKR